MKYIQDAVPLNEWRLEARQRKYEPFDDETLIRVEVERDVVSQGW